MGKLHANSLSLIFLTNDPPPLPLIAVPLCKQQPSEMEVEAQVHLYGHTGEVTSLFVCKPYSVLISVSKDGTCILWDLNRWVELRPPRLSLQPPPILTFLQILRWISSVQV